MSRFDRQLAAIFAGIVLALLALGTVMIFSASGKIAMESPGIGDPAFFLKKHLVFLGLGLIGFFAATRLDPARLRPYAKLIYLATLALLVLVLIPGIGTSYNGARRWLRFAGIGVQPSDVAKLSLVFVLAHDAATRGRTLGNFRLGFVPAMARLALPCLLIVLEPDFGTTVFVAGVGFLVLWLGGIRPRHLLPVVLVALPLVTTVVVLKFDHIKPRLATYLNPDADPEGKGYQVRQSLIALGAGGLTGVGLGHSRQALYYLPEESTDFIFSILGEELGFAGTSVTVLLYALLIAVGLRVAYLSGDPFRRLLAAGMTALIGGQALLNIGVVTATLPNKGIALPFISFGGSLTVGYCIAAGVVVNLAARSRSATSEPAVALTVEALGCLSAVDRLSEPRAPSPRALENHA